MVTRGEVTGGNSPRGNLIEGNWPGVNCLGGNFPLDLMITLLPLKEKYKKTTQEYTNIQIHIQNCKQNLAGIYLFKVNNENTKTMYEICSKLTIKTLEGRQ